MVEADGQVAGGFERTGGGLGLAEAGFAFGQVLRVDALLVLFHPRDVGIAEHSDAISVVRGCEGSGFDDMLDGLARQAIHHVHVERLDAGGA